VPSVHAEAHFHENGRPHQQTIVLPRANHFPFLEHSSTFGRLLLDFLVSEGTPVEIKEQWRRRVSQREYL
jgi:pimeloyl-ACP methyl ester carboxylesterase